MRFCGKEVAYKQRMSGCTAADDSNFAASQDQVVCGASCTPGPRLWYILLFTDPSREMRHTISSETGGAYPSQSLFDRIHTSDPMIS